METGGNQDQEGKDHRFFEKNDLIHHVFKPAKIVTVGFLVGVLYLISVVLSNYKLALSEVDARIDNYKPLNQRLDKMDWRLDDLRTDIDKHDKELDDLSKAINVRKR